MDNLFQNQKWTFFVSRINKQKKKKKGEGFSRHKGGKVTDDYYASSMLLTSIGLVLRVVVVGEAE